MDKPEDLADGSVPGVKNAAVRKLDHELGISAQDVPIESFKFLTRLHYYAADAVTHGPNAPWGEHEIDYILFIQASVVVLTAVFAYQVNTPRELVLIFLFERVGCRRYYVVLLE